MIDFKDTSLTDKLQIDKIVRTYNGSFNAATQTITRTGDITNILIYTISHDLTRPVLCDMQWSLDNNTWYDMAMLDGSGRSSLAYSTDSQINIISPVSSGTVYFRVWCIWIDDYDSSNPLIELESNNDTPLIYDSRLNIQKVYEANVISYSGGTFGSNQTLTVNHTLGYRPNVKSWFEAFANEVWPLNSGGTTNPYAISFTQDEALARIYTNRVEFDAVRFSNQSRKIWYRIYYDQT